MAKIACVALDNAALYFDKLYDYLIPPELERTAKNGIRVLVPFGRGNRNRQGIIMRVYEGAAENKKSVISVLDSEPYLNDEMLKLAAWLKDTAFCSYYDVVKAMLPKGIGLKNTVSFKARKVSVAKADKLFGDYLGIYKYLTENGGWVERDEIIKVFGLKKSSDIPEYLEKTGYAESFNNAKRNAGDASEKMIRLCAEDDKLDEIVPLLTPKQKSVADLLRDTGGASVKEVLYFCGVTKAVADAVVKKGIAEYYESEIYRNPYKNAPDGVRDEIKLNSLQQSAYDKILNDYKEKKSALCALLYGVTGSGKTQVYLKLIDKVIDAGRQVILMVPEISLTPQTLALFHKRYGRRIAVFHSRLSVGQRMDEWKRAKNHEADIVVGTRSAVFAPLDNIGLIILDEEQEHTYKSEQTPRYHATEVAKFRCVYHNALLVLGSATPSVESFAYALCGRYSLAEIPKRFGNSILPEVYCVDMRNELNADGTKRSVSCELESALKDNYKNKEQSILLINRRGYHTFAVCNVCETVLTCPNCSISLTYHKANRRAMCHYCGYSVEINHMQCAECGSHDIRLSGTGTQRVEEELRRILPGGRILRMDMDTTLNKQAHEKMLSAFSNGDYDVLIGTQMVAKGLDFPSVTLVGVLNADSTLYNYDYRCAENTFDLITQVVGRSGRGDKKGKAYIQTDTPDNPIIEIAARQDYREFYKSEIKMRELMVYPPYCDLCLVGFVGTDESSVSNGASYFLKMLRKYSSEEFTEQKMIVLGPLPARVAKANNKYRYRLIIKCKNGKRFREMIRKVLFDYYNKKEFKAVTAFIDINPADIM